ncbi:MAG: hypothetical protein V9F03_03970 [Microthrixaceae bacterium]
MNDERESWDLDSDEVPRVVRPRRRASIPIEERRDPGPRATPVDDWDDDDGDWDDDDDFDDGNWDDRRDGRDSSW